MSLRLLAMHYETDTDTVSATQTIFHDAKRPSHIVLPVIPPDRPATAPTVRR